MFTSQQISSNCSGGHFLADADFLAFYHFNYCNFRCVGACSDLLHPPPPPSPPSSRFLNPTGLLLFLCDHVRKQSFIFCIRRGAINRKWGIKLEWWCSSWEGGWRAGARAADPPQQKKRRTGFLFAVCSCFHAEGLSRVSEGWSMKTAETGGGLTLFSFVLNLYLTREEGKHKKNSWALKSLFFNRALAKTDRNRRTLDTKILSKSSLSCHKTSAFSVFQYFLVKKVLFCDYIVI